MPIENNALVQRALHLLRGLHLVDLPDYARFALRYAKALGPNKAFLQDNPGFLPPSQWRMYEAYSHCDYRVYFRMGLDTATHFSDLITKHAQPGKLAVLEWGCGPARIIRHLPNLLGTRIERLVGSDYNAESIEYCKRALNGIEFLQNGLEPPIACDEAAFDVVYAMSVFTHLSEAMHYAWVGEIRRILKPGGILIASFHGRNYEDKLLPEERVRYLLGDLVVRGGTLEGSHMYAAYHPPEFLAKVLFNGFDVLETFEQVPGVSSQAIWVLRR